MEPVERLRRLVRRGLREQQYINTINAQDRVQLHFVWFPGESRMSASWMDTLVDDHPRTSARRNLYYRWHLDGQASVRRIMDDTTITVPLPKGSSGTLTVFSTEWRVTRVADGVSMTAANQCRGVQQRLNRLGYHLRRPGAENPGVDNVWGRRTEHAVMQFQVDYRPQPAAPAAAANRLKVRGEWTNNTNAAYTNNLTGYVNASPNPSAADATALQAALRAIVGA